MSFLDTKSIKNKLYKARIGIFKFLAVAVILILAAEDVQCQSLPLRIKEEEKTSSSIHSQPLTSVFSPTIDTAMKTTVDTAALAHIAQIKDTLAVDTARKQDKILMTDVKYKAKDFYDIDETKKCAYFYNEAEVEYGDIKINAGYIMLDYGNGIAYARGIMNDTTGVQEQKPIFSQGQQSYDAYSMIYDFNTKRGYIKNVKTEQTEGYAAGRSVRKEGEEVYYASDFYFSTDEKLRGWIDGTGELTDYYIRSSRAKMTAGKSMVVGFSQMYIADVPTPLVLPFAFFPLNNYPTSGVILPSYTISEDQGFGLTGLGYYFVVNDYLHLTLNGDIYTKGSWGIQAKMDYIWKYHFRGNLAFEYSNVVMGEIGLPNYSKSKPWRLQWSHTQDSKWIPGLSLSASVNFSSSGYYENSLDQIYTNNYVTNSVTSSSISLNKVWGNSPFTTSLNITQSQNNSTKMMSLTMPNFTLTMNQLYPFKKESSSGKKWYEKIRLSWTMTATNTASEMPIDAFLTKDMNKYTRAGVTHNIPISASYKVLRNFTLSVGVNYSEAWNFKVAQKYWDEASGKVMTDTLSRFKALRTFNATASLNTTLYGTFNFGNKGSLRAIRHVMNMQLGYGFRPDFSTPFWGYYYDVQTGGAMGAVEHYSYFDGGLGPASPPGWGSQSQSISLSFVNSFEGKVVDKSDTTGTKTKKIKLLDGLTFGASYDMAATSFRLRLNDITGRTSFFNNKINVQFGMSLSPYKVDKDYKLIDEYCFPRLVAARVSSGFSIANSDFGKKRKEEEKLRREKQTGNDERDRELESKNKNQDSEGDYDDDGYMVYSPSWDISLTQTFSYSKTGATPSITNALGVSGRLSFTKKWSMTASTGYDFQRSEWAEVRFGFSRDLNTWNINFSWAPVSYYSNYNFFIGIKANMLKDLKYEQRKTYRKSIL